MLINNTAYKDQYTSDGNTVAFPITFPFFENSQVKVYYSPEGSEEANLVESTTYTITGAGSESGGTLTFTTTPEAGITIAILRDMPITQTYEYTELDNFPAESHENALAKLTMICQELKEETDRSIKVPATSTDPAEDYAVQMFEASATAQQSVSAAATSATSAAASEASALASKSAAAGSATAAASSASAASASAAAAATSEANASDSETAASSSASAAASSAIASAGSASAAATSEQAAASSASAASASASAAATSESNALASKQAAATSEASALASKSAAAGSAVTAEAWAESETPPDPNDTESKSAKTWALSAAASIPIASTTHAGKVMASASLYVDQTTGEATVPNIVPTGGIIMWSGSTSTIPIGWGLCDGTNGTPDLRDRFIIGAGGTYDIGDTGGSTEVSGTVGSTTLTTAQMPSHKHSYNFRGNTVSCPADGTRSVWYNTTATDSGTTGSSSAHSHTFTGAADSNLPPYYALAYIMKL